MSAYLTDSLIVALLLLLVRLFLAGIMELLEGTALGGNVLFQYTLKDMILYVFHVLYFILFTYYSGTTPGKKLLNLRVISADDAKLTLTDVLYRETIGRFLCNITIGIGYIMVGIDKEKQGLHDMLSDTRVIYARKITVIPAYAQQMPNVPNVPNVPRQVTPPMPGEPERMTPPMPDVPPQAIPPQNYTGSYHMADPQKRNEKGDS